MNNAQLAELFTRYVNNQCTASEIRQLLEHFQVGSEEFLHKRIAEELRKQPSIAINPNVQRHADDVWRQIKQKIGTEELPTLAIVADVKRKPTIRLWLRITAAACVLFLIAISTYLFKRTDRPMPAVQVAVQTAQDTLAPGADRATLTLSNGRRINLDNSQSGLLATEGIAKIQKAGDGKVVYESAGVSPSSEVTYNILTTPRGGKYDLTLSDGTKVWLNAASSIRYPSVFSGNTREVEITGEAYFEVKHDASKPFRVKTLSHVVEDIGTSFNVNAYNDEPVVKTTLIEGSVKVTAKNGSAILKPGEQAVMGSEETLRVNHEADVEEAIAWHKGLFNFHDADIQTVMRQLARWYDVEISYEGAAPQRRFSGKIYRNISALKVADLLSYKQIHFRIEGRKIIVMP